MSRLLLLGTLLSASLLALIGPAQAAAQTWVNPDGAAVSVAANQTGLTVTFTIGSGTSNSITLPLTKTCTGQVTNCSAPAQATFTGGVTAVKVTYNTLGPGSGVIRLTAGPGLGGSSDQGSFNVTVNPPFRVSVTPDAGSVQPVPANTGGYTAPFTVSNTGSNSNTFSFSCSGAGGVVCGTVPAPVTLAGNGGNTLVNMPYSVGAAGTGTLTLTATGTSASDAGSYSVPIVTYGVSVTPDGATAATRTPNTGGHSESFVVRNTGTGTNTYSFTCSGAGGVTCGTVPSGLTLAGDTQTSVSMPYSVGAAGTGTLTLTATGTSASDAGSFSVPIASYGVAVTPDGATAPMRTPNTGGHSESFVVQNTGTGSNTYSFTCAGATGVTCGTLPAPVTLAASAQTNVSMPYSVGAPGTGTLTLTATGIGASNAGSYSVPIGGFVVITPATATLAAQRLANTGGYSESFTFQNLGLPSTFNFSCQGVGGVTCGAVPAPVTLATNQLVTRTMPYSVGTGPQMGTLILSASNGSVGASGTYNIPIVLAIVEVTPDGGVEPARLANSVGHRATFVVRNGGGPSNTYSFSCVGASGVICGIVPAPIALAPNTQANVLMPYSVGAAGTGTLTFTATGTNATDEGSYSVTINPGGAPVSLSWVDGSGMLTKDSRYLLQETANTYDADGRITQRSDARGSVTNYQYGGNVTNAFLTRVTDVHDATGVIDLATDIAYDSDGLVESIRDPGGSFRRFTYDTYSRLRQIKDHSGTVVKAFGYSYSATDGNSWVFQADSPNAVAESTFVQQTPTLQVVVSTRYLDGLGEQIQAVVQDGSNYHVSATQYDAMRRPWRTWRPYTRAVAGFDRLFVDNATAFYTAYHGSTAAPYVETQYRLDPLDRVSKIIPAYLGTTPAVWKLTNYGVDPAAMQLITEQVDESGKTTRDHTDLFGNKVRSILGYGASEATTTAFDYNVLGQRTQATDPRGLNTDYTLNTRGLLTTRTSPDAGVINSKYDRAGNLRFSQDANQAAAGQVYFVNYDFAGRHLNSGVGAVAFSAVIADQTAAIETNTANWLIVRSYDAKPSTTTFPWSLFSTEITPLSLANVAGRLAAVASKSGSAWQVTLFSYDADGQLESRYTYTQNNAGSAVLTSINTTAGYLRDLRGAITQRQVSVGANSFYQWYDYDNRGLLWKLYAATSSTKPATPDATDTYRPDEQPQDYQFQGGPLVPIRYTIRGETAQIGDPAATTYPFSARYTYNPNGTALETEFRSSGSPATDKRFRYGFSTYDALNRIKGADYTGFSGSTPIGTQAYDLAQIDYDRSGNITAMQRYREAATLIDNLTYTYPAGSNRLSSVSDAIAATTETWDAESGSFTYDANGNIATSPAPYSISAASYNYQNLPVSVTRAGVTSTYRYDDAGERITKQVGTGNTEVYVREGATPLAVIAVDGSGAIASWHFNLLWENRVVGRQPVTGSPSYYHLDAVGSTRAVVQGATIVESYDYDPWGSLLAGRTLGSGTKEGFGGKERDVETDLSYFGARYYMPVLGRWTSVDPSADQMPEWSPYNFVYNNPALKTDPDGRQPRPAGAVPGGTLDPALRIPTLAPPRPGMFMGLAARASAKIADGVAGATPGVSAARDATVVLFRVDLSFEPVNNVDRMLALVGLLTPASGAELKAAQKGLEEVAAGVRTGQRVLGPAEARALGLAGEEAAGLVKNNIRIPSATGSALFRVPDALSPTTLTEVKNVAKLSLTNQIRDFADFARKTGRSFDLIVRKDTELTAPLREFIEQQNITLRFLPW